MPKRLTATEKWSDVWFRKLSVEAKVLFEYIRDNCDIAGFWEVDLETASFHTGIPQELKDGFDGMKPTRGIEGAFKELERCYIALGRHIWLKNFLYHQKNLPLNPENPCHKGILTIIHSHNTFSDIVLGEIKNQIIQKGLEGASKGLLSPIGKGKGKGKGKFFGKYENLSLSETQCNSVKHRETVSYTLQQVQDACIVNGIAESNAQSYYDQYNSQNWCKANGQSITNLQSHIAKRWNKRKQSWDFDEGKESVYQIERGPDGLTPHDRIIQETEKEKRLRHGKLSDSI